MYTICIWVVCWWWWVVVNKCWAVSRRCLGGFHERAAHPVYIRTSWCAPNKKNGKLFYTLNGVFLMRSLYCGSYRGEVLHIYLLVVASLQKIWFVDKVMCTISIINITKTVNKIELLFCTRFAEHQHNICQIF